MAGPSRGEQGHIPALRRQIAGLGAIGVEHQAQAVVVGRTKLVLSFEGEPAIVTVVRRNDKPALQFRDPGIEIEIEGEIAVARRPMRRRRR